MIRVNRSHPLNRGLLSWWLAVPGRIGNGNVLADIAGNNPASSTALMPTQIAGMGVVGMAAHYDGSTQYARAICPALSAYTFAAWVRFDNLTGASIVKNWGEISNGYLHWDASLAGPGIVRAYVTATGGVAFATAGNTLSTGVAYRLAVTAGGGNIDLYCNGVSVGTDTYSGTLSSTLGYLGFGCKLTDDGSTRSLVPLTTGTIGDVSMWGRALSATEIAQLDYEMRAGYPGMLIRDRTPSLMVGLGQAFRPWYSPAYAGLLGTGAA